MMHRFDPEREVCLRCGFTKLWLRLSSCWFSCMTYAEAEAIQRFARGERDGEQTLDCST